MTAVANPFNDFVFLNATPSDRGSFTLALDKALDKLEKFQLPDPSFFVLQWIQAVVASEATIIIIDLETNSFLGQYEMRIAFDGPGYTARELQSLYDHVFLSGRDRAQDRLRELSLGWLSASSLKPSRLAMISNGWARVRDKTTSGSKSGEATHENTTLRERPQQHLLEISGKGSYPFEEMIASRCSDVPICLILNGNQVSHPSVSTGVPWPNRAFENGPSKGVIGATYGADSSTQISFLRYGVNYVTRAEPALMPPVIVRVSDPTLSKNVSQTDVVKDDAYEEFLARMRSEMKSMGLSLTRQRIPSYQRESLNRYLQAYIASHLDIRALEDPKRLELLGPDYESLLNFPVFCSTRSVYRSLLDLHHTYKRQGSLLYCVDPEARALNWAGVLLVLQPEEVTILRKFFPNLHGISLETIKAEIRSGRPAVSAPQNNGLLLAKAEVHCASRYYRLSIPDSYPTGVAVLRPEASLYGTALPGLKLTLTVEYLDEVPPNHTDIINLGRGVLSHLDGLKTQLARWVCLEDSSVAFSRSRAAELLCELLNVELQEAQGQDEQRVSTLVNRVRDFPLIGLEDGRLASLRDIETFLGLVSCVYLGGVFIEGLDSGALDPMPEASKLLARLYPPHQLIPTERIRAELCDDPHHEVRFELRRQTLLCGLSRVPEPRRALEQFATAAAVEAAEVAQIEREYRQAFENPNLFVAPSEQRLASLSALDHEGDELPLLDLTALPSEPTPTTVVSQASIASKPTPIPTLESDKEMCRGVDPDFFPPRDSLHVERREVNFSLHLATCSASSGVIFFLHKDGYSRLEIPQPVRGFIRTLPGGVHTEVLLREGLEQLVIRAAHAFTEGPPNARMRRALRQWLFRYCCCSTPRLLASQQQPNDLFDLPVVACLGEKYLSWRTLLEQARRFGQTVVYEGTEKLSPSPAREVIRLHRPMTSELLQALGFPTQLSYQPSPPEPPFEELYRSTRRDLASVLSGQTTPLLQTNLVEQLASDASLWKRWRSGFLSWDQEQAVVVMNPNHKVGQRLAQRFASDDSWSRIFASALFSTINRGLEEVEDKHERAFLEALVDSLD